MNYYFYLTSPSIPTSFISEEFPSFGQVQSNPSFYASQKFLIAPTFSNTELTFIEPIHFPSQPNLSIPTLNEPRAPSFVQFEQKEIKKR